MSVAVGTAVKRVTSRYIIFTVTHRISKIFSNFRYYNSNRETIDELIISFLESWEMTSKIYTCILCGGAYSLLFVAGTEGYGSMTKLSK